MAGARLSNEEIYLIQKTARTVAKTNNVGSFSYLARGDYYAQSAQNNVPFQEIRDTSKVYLIGDGLFEEHPVLGYMIQNAFYKKDIEVSVLNTNKSQKLNHKFESQAEIGSFYHFFKAANHYILSNGLENALFIKDRIDGFDDYKKALLAEDYALLIQKAGICCLEKVESFVKEYLHEMNNILVFSEAIVSSETAQEIHNLALISGKLGKTANGLISLKEKNNSQAIFDMGAQPQLLTGQLDINSDEAKEKIKQIWNTEAPTSINNLNDLMKDGKIKNAFIFGEDPVGTTLSDISEGSCMDKMGFTMVQDYFMTATAKKADLVMPASMPIETGGSYTNTQRYIQEFEAHFTPKVAHSNHKQMLAILEKFDFKGLNDLDDIKAEMIKFFPQP
ncbi:MAG: hypothetical protein B7C24_07920, partial [Bacteroidetes bacterium 4572_77]